QNNAQMEYKSESEPEYDFLLNNKNYQQDPVKTYTHGSSNDFLKADRPITRFVGKAEEIKEHIQEAFEKTTAQKLPEHIIINVVPKEELKRLHMKGGNQWSEGIMGFAINKSIPEVFIKENNMDQLMLTIGHELGHVFTKSLKNQHDEEAKAFAFEIAWIKAILENDIAGLKDSFTLDINPAKNGLHDVAFDNVKKWLQKGKNAIDVYWDLVRGILKIDQTDYSFLDKMF
ncbi:MAG: hypothetical protein KKA79_08315, partial [Nanoarchaeota archaeon]|nr:hypothetical protein [Nanoarchaeota archaeon]